MNLKLIKTLIRAMELDNGTHTTKLAEIIADELGHGPVVAQSETMWHEPDVDEVYAGLHISKLEAIKRHKHRTKCSLIDSKRILEKYFTDNGLKFFDYK